MRCMCVLLVADSRSATCILFKIFLMFIIVAVKAEQFPIAAIRRVIIVVVILVMDREFTELPASEFAAAPRADVGIHFERPLAIVLLT